jgi:2,4-dienoyl-CoA reductase-like NADH-dependent reductase (Old Yellow Enzyme family)
MSDTLFQPLQFRNLRSKNRIFRSNISGRFDNYDGSGNQARINWELKFARGGVGAIISSYVPVTIRGRIVPGYATIDTDARIPFWRELGKRVHEHDCLFILQLSHGGRQRDIAGLEYPTGLSSTDRPDPVHGFQCERMTVAQIRETVAAFAAGARRAREAGLDGVELHAANGYLFTQFLSSAINDRQDEYGGPLANRARFLLDVIAAIRAETGREFHLQVKLSAADHNTAVAPLEPDGNTVDDTVQVVKWAEAAGVDAFHISTGSSFPHPRNPAGDFPVADVVRNLPAMVPGNDTEFRTLLALRFEPAAALAKALWERARGETIEGINLPDCRRITQAVRVPVICTGGFQTASVIRRAIEGGDCDAVSIARPLVANNDLVRMFERGLEQAPKPCTYCNKCLMNVPTSPLGCYEESRFGSREEMVRQIMSVFDPPPFR